MRFIVLLDLVTNDKDCFTSVVVSYLSCNVGLAMLTQVLCEKTPDGRGFC